MKKILLLVIILTVGLILVIPISAAETGIVTATVTPKVISVTVSPTAISYGTVQLGQNDVSPTPDTVIVVTNNGTVNEKLDIKGANASTLVGGTTYNWTLSSSSTGENQFMHKRALSPYETWVALSTSYTQFIASESPAGGRSLKFKISMPTTITGEAGQYSTTITILAQEA